MEYLLYCRKSSEDKNRQQLSIPAQVREMGEFAAKHNLTIRETFSEEKSARKPGRRSEFNAMISKIRKGECRRILCWHTNRLSRNPEEGGMLQQLLADGVLLEIRTPYESIDTSTNDIMVGVSFGSNSQYSKELSYNTRRGLREKVSRGEWPTLAPAFYRNCGDRKGNKNIEPDPMWGRYYSLWVDQIINNRLNLTQATRLLKEMGVRTRHGKFYTQSMVHRIMRMPVYYGLLEYGDLEPVQGTWEPLVSKSRWLALQQVLDDKSKPNLTKHNHAYRKLLLCPRCGMHIVPYTKIKNGHKYTYYSCSKRNGNCGNQPIRIEELDDQLSAMVSQVSINEGTLIKLKELTAAKLAESHSFETDKVADVEIKLNAISKNLDQLLQMRMNGELSGEEYLQTKKKLLSEKEHYENTRSSVRVNRDDVRIQLEQFFDSAFSLETTFANGTLEQKSRIVYALCERIELDDRNIRWNFRKPWQRMVLVKSDPKPELMGGWRGSNPRPSVPQTDAPPTELQPPFA